jgi:hypothetical protein
MIFPDIPGGGCEGGEEASGKNSACLERGDAEDIAEMVLVDAPVIDDVEDFGADNSAKHDENTEVPGFVAVDAHAFAVAHADPEADQDAGRNQQAIGGQEEAAVMKNLRKHLIN